MAEAPAEIARFTIVVPAHNAQRTIARAIESVRAQTSSAWELVIVDDGSTDETLSVVEGFQGDRRVRVIQQPQCGVAMARNVGVDNARTDVVVFLDADDELMPGHLAVIEERMRMSPDWDAYFPNVVVRRPGRQDVLLADCSEVESVSFDDLLAECSITVGGAAIRRTFLTDVGGFRSGILCEDYELWLRATSRGARFLRVPAPLYVYHRDVDGRRSEDTVRAAKDLENVLVELIDSGARPESRAAIERAIRRARDLPHMEKQNRAMEAQSEWFASALLRVFGPRLAPGALSLAHKVSWMARPFRRALASMRNKR